MRLAATICICATTLTAQSAVEYGVGASRAATSTAPAKGLGKSISGIAGSIDRVIKSQPSGSKAPAETSVRRVDRPSPSPKSTAVYEDLKHAEVGLSYEELVKRFGPPAMVVSASAGRKSLTYLTKDGPTQIEMQDQKVVSIK